MKSSRPACHVCGSLEWEVPPSYVPSAIPEICARCGLMRTDRSRLTDQETSFSFENRRAEYEDALHNPKHHIRMYKANVVKLRRAKRYITGRRMLDVGCGVGFAVKAGLSLGFDVSAIELTDFPRKYVAEQYGVKAYKYMDKALRERPKYYDLIYLSHIIEHIDDPGQFFKAIIALLADDGIIVVSVPNPYSPIAKLARDRWGGWSAFDHRYHYSKRSLQYLLDLSGFKTISIFTGARCETHWIQGLLKNEEERGMAYPRFIQRLPQRFRIKLLEYTERIGDRITTALGSGDEAIAYAKKS